MIRRWLISGALVVMVMGLALGAEAGSGKKSEKVPVYYLSLGTSLAAGVQADPETGESVVTDVSYPGELSAILGDDITSLRHMNLGCPGETATSFIDGGVCQFPQGSQLEQAVSFLGSHGKFTGLITIDLGANDVLECVDGVSIDLQCFTDQLNLLAGELGYILQTLRGVAPDVPVVGMNYYNPLLVYWFDDPAIAEMTAELQSIINQTLAEVYGSFQVPVADVAGAFMADDLETDLTGPEGVPNEIPDSVDLLCAWTWMCTHLNIHANDLGYTVMAEEFAAVLPEIPLSEPVRKQIPQN